MSKTGWDIIGDYWNFDTDYYVANYRDLQQVANRMGNEEKKQFLVNHFYRHGFEEGRLYRWKGMPPCRCYPKCVPWMGCKAKSECNCENCIEKLKQQKPPPSETYEIYDNRFGEKEENKIKRNKEKCSQCGKKKR